VKRTPIKALSCAAIDVKPVDYYWSEGFGEKWDLVYPDVTDWDRKQCMAWLDGENTDLDDLLLDKDSPLDKIQDAIRNRMQENPDRYTPMMNCYYPLPNLRLNPSEAQEILDNSSCALTVVMVDDEPVMALTGGGMDFSWDICGAYMLLGYLPPVHFRLPDMCRTLTPYTRWVMAGCTRSIRVSMNWGRSLLADMKRLRENMAERTAAQASPKKK